MKMVEKEITITVKREKDTAESGGILSSIKQMVSSKGAGAGGSAGGIAGMFGKLAGSLGLMVGLLAGIAAAILLIVQSSKILQNTLGRIIQVIMLLLRPIGDFIGIALQPLIWMLMPLVRTLNTLFRPFLMAFRKNLAEQRAEGAFDIGSENFNPFGAVLSSIIGASIEWFSVIGSGLFESMLHGIIDIMTDSLKIINSIIFTGIGLLIQAFQGLGNVFLDVIGIFVPDDVIAEAKKSFNAVMNTLYEGITSDDGIKGSFDKAIDVMGESAKLRVTGVFDGIRSALMGLDLETITEKFETDMETADKLLGTAFDGIVTAVEELIENLNKAIETGETQLPSSKDDTTDPEHKILDETEETVNESIGLWETLGGVIQGVFNGVLNFTKLIFKNQFLEIFAGILQDLGNDFFDKVDEDFAEAKKTGITEMNALKEWIESNPITQVINVVYNTVGGP
jgi:hypothetical protein